MYKIQSVDIKGFWHTKGISASFDEKVNIIIGRNGTGKTTFMNILQSILSVDTEGLFENYFDVATIELKDGSKTRKVTVERFEQENVPFPLVKYKISNRSFTLPLFGPEEVRPHSISLRRRTSEDVQSIKEQLSELVAISSLSVYRLGSDIDPDSRERYARKSFSAVDLRLQSLINRLTQYQLELSNRARLTAAELQRDVLVSLLYTSQDQSFPRIPKEFDEGQERQKLTAAYRQLGVSGSDVTKKIQEHTSAVARTVKHFNEGPKDQGIDIRAFDALRTTQNVVRMSLAAEAKNEGIFKQANLFTDKLKEFVTDKKFEFVNGILNVKSPDGISISKLSSGEKQLLILFIETLLQREKPYIFLADEPELSLHIAWQRNIIRAIRELNPSAQVIVATHSPEIAGPHRSNILDIEDLTNG